MHKNWSEHVKRPKFYKNIKGYGLPLKILLNQHFYARVGNFPTLRCSSLKMLITTRSKLIPKRSTEVALFFSTDFISLAIVVSDKQPLFQLQTLEHLVKNQLECFLARAINFQPKTQPQDRSIYTNKSRTNYQKITNKISS